MPGFDPNAVLRDLRRTRAEITDPADPDHATLREAFDTAETYMRALSVILAKHIRKPAWLAELRGGPFPPKETN